MDSTLFPPVPATTGLALSGGGARGAYQVGCWKALQAMGISFAAVSGSSIGAVNGALVCQGDIRAAEALWNGLAQANLFFVRRGNLFRFLDTLARDLALLMLPLPNLKAVKLAKYSATLIKLFSADGALRMLGREGLINPDAVKEVLAEHLDLKRVLDGPRPLFVTTWSMPRISELLRSSRTFSLQDFDEESAWRVLLASMALPLLFPGISIRGRDHRDGVLAEWLPLRPLAEHKMTHIVAISTKPMPSAVAVDVPGVEVLLIAPAERLGRFPMSTLRFTRENISTWIETGYEDARRILNSDGGRRFLEGGPSSPDARQRRG